MIKQRLFNFAIDNNLVNVVKLLLRDSDVDPSARNNGAIRWAAKYGHTEVVKLLLSDKRVDPTVRDNAAIRHAAANGHAEIVKLLLSDDRVRRLYNKKENIYV